MIFIVSGMVSCSFASSCVPSMSGSLMSSNARLKNLVFVFSNASFAVVAHAV